MIAEQQSSLNNGPIRPLRVLEMTNETGQYCGKLLAELGADVIKIEPPGGSSVRSYGPFMNDKYDPEKSLYFWHYNTSKRGVTLAIETLKGKEMFTKLIQVTDVLVETFAPGHLESLGLGYKALAKVNPNLIMASITPFGQTGPYRDFKTSDLVSSALGGLMFSCGYDDVPGSPPINPDGGQTFHTASEYAAIGILAALFARNITGLGQYIDVSIHEAVNGTTEWAIPMYWYHGKNVWRQTGRHATHVETPKSQYRAKDGRYVNITGVIPRDIDGWNKLIDWMDEHGFAQDLRAQKYTDLLAGRIPGVNIRNAHQTADGQHIFKSITRFVESLNSDEVYHGGQSRGLQWSVARPPDELLDEDHWWQRGFFTNVEYPEIGKQFTHPGVPYKLSQNATGVNRRAPLIGEHNQEIFGLELGLAREEIDALKADSVI
jgi:crotonobetainyl-CoA:carnitine CoA-transferase CaiB-like acyl-CoA transferase